MASKDVVLRLLVETVDNTSKSLSQIKSGLSQLGQAGAEAAQKLTAMGQQVTESMQRAASELNRTTEAARNLSEAADKMMQIGTTLGMVGAGMLAFSAIPVKFAADFDYAAVRMAAYTGDLKDWGSNLDIMSKKAKELGSTTLFTATQAADGMRLLGMAGLSAKEVISAIPTVLNMATAASMDLAQASDMTIQVLKGMGLQISDMARVTDVLSYVANASISEVASLGEAMKYAASVASAAGVSIEETAAAMGVLSNAGRGATMAGTDIRRMILALEAPTKKATDALKQMGVQISHNADGTLNFMKTMESLGKANMTSAQAFAMFGKEGTSAALILARSIPAWKEMTIGAQNSAGATAELSKIMAGTAVGSFKMMKAAAESLLTSIGTPLLSVLQPLVAGFTGVMRAVTELAERWPMLTGLVIGSVAVLGTFAVSIGAAALAVGGMTKAVALLGESAVWSGIVTGITGVLTALKALLLMNVGDAIATIARGFVAMFAIFAGNPILIAVTAIVAALGGLVYMVDQSTQAWKDQKKAAEESSKKVAEASEATERFKDSWEKVTPGTKEATKALTEWQKILGKTASSTPQLADAATAAASSIDALNGKITDGGRAMREWDVAIMQEKMRSAVAESAATYEELNAKMLGVLTEQGNTYNRHGLNIVQYLKLLTKAGRDEIDSIEKRFQTYAKNTVAQWKAMGTIDTTMSIREFGAVLDGLGVKTKAVRDEFTFAFVQMKDAANAAANEEASLASAAEKTAAVLRRRADEARDQAIVTVSRYKMIDEAAKRASDSAAARGAAILERTRALQTYASALTEMANEEVRVVKDAESRKLAEVKSAEERGVITKKDAQMKSLAIVAEGEAAVAAVRRRAADEFRANIDVSTGTAKTQYDALVNAAAESASKLKMAYDKYLDAVEAKVRDTMQKAIAEHEKYVQAVKKAEEDLANAQKTAQQRIRELQRGAMTEEQQLLDKRAEAQERFAAAKAALDAKISAGTASKEDWAEFRREGEAAMSEMASSVKAFGDKGKATFSELKDGATASGSTYQEELNKVLPVLQQMQASYESMLQKQIAMAKEQESASSAAIAKIKADLDTITAARAAQITIELPNLQQMVNEVDAFVSKKRTITVDVVQNITSTQASQTAEYATGGVVDGRRGARLHGYGGGDSVMALLEPGEMVVRKEAVKARGIAPLLRAINEMRFPQIDALLSGMPFSRIRDALGSIQMPTIPRIAYATGGVVGHDSLGVKELGRVELAIGGKAYPVLARPAVVDELKKAIRRESLVRSR